LIYHLAADAVLLLHAAFIVFVLFGALAALRWRWWPWLHLPAAAWGVWVSVAGVVCPLTPLENRLRAMAGQQGFEGGFIEHYLLALIYPEGLTRPIQWALAGVVVVLNLALYAWVWRRRRRRMYG
jgi:Protein of Unknown function (DUF2784)